MLHITFYMLHVIKVNVKEDINLRVGGMGRVTQKACQRG